MVAIEYNLLEKQNIPHIISIRFEICRVQNLTPVVKVQSKLLSNGIPLLTLTHDTL